MLKTVILLTLLNSAAWAQQLTLLQDGHIAYCNNAQDEKDSREQKALQISPSMIIPKIGTTYVDLYVKLVKCVNLKWQQDSSPSRDIFDQIIPLGKDGAEKETLQIVKDYSNYNLVVKGLADGSVGEEIFFQAPLKDLEKNGEEDITVAIPTRYIHNRMEVFVNFRSSGRASNGVDITTRFSSFASSYLRLDSEGHLSPLTLQ